VKTRGRVAAGGCKIAVFRASAGGGARWRNGGEYQNGVSRAVLCFAGDAIA